jgi:hypothetical protein
LFVAFVVVAVALIIGSSITIVGALLHFSAVIAMADILHALTTGDPMTIGESHVPAVVFETRGTVL